MARSKSNIISREESDFIRIQLTLRRPREVKAALQRLCAYYDRGSRLADAHVHQMLIRALLWDDAPIIRRWSYKALGMMGQQRDSFEVIQRLKCEGDIENQTWGIAAVVALNKDAELRQVCFETGLDQAMPLLLAARIFAAPRWL